MHASVASTAIRGDPRRKSWLVLDKRIICLIVSLLFQLLRAFTEAHTCFSTHKFSEQTPSQFRPSATRPDAAAATRTTRAATPDRFWIGSNDSRFSPLATRMPHARALDLRAFLKILKKDAPKFQPCAEQTL